jgi:hypothetical protein
MGNAGQILWMGTGCAAKSAGVGIKELKASAEAAQVAVETEENKRRNADLAKFAAWVAERGTGADYFNQLQSIGGYRAARDAYDAGRAA